MSCSRDVTDTADIGEIGLYVGASPGCVKCCAGHWKLM